MLLGSFRRKVEERADRECREEIFRIAAEWDKLSPGQKGMRSIANFFRARYRELDEERKTRREEREAPDDDPTLFRLLYIPFGYIPYFGSE